MGGERYVELYAAEKAAAGETAAKEPLILRVTDDGYLIAKVRALDIDDTGEDIDLVCTPDGALKTAIDFVLGDLTLTMGDLEKLAAGQYWLATKIEYDSNDPKRIKYVGLHTTMNVATSDSGWRLIHIDYDGTSTRITGVWKQTDAWDDRDAPAVAWP
jgi:hypothetical protein